MAKYGVFPDAAADLPDGAYACTVMNTGQGDGARPAECRKSGDRVLISLSSGPIVVSIESARPMNDGQQWGFVATDPDYKPFIDRLEGMIGPLLPRFDAEGKSYLTIAVGCTGGRHRSVAVAERLADWLRSAGRSVTLSHRDVDVRGGQSAGSSKSGMVE